MIRVELGEEIGRRGVWVWTVSHYALEGRSRQPLLDACRALKSMGANPTATVGLFREGKVDAEGNSRPDMTCTVGDGAMLTVVERDRGAIHFERWQAKPMAMVRLTIQS